MRLVHLKREPFDIRIDRASIFGNPWSSKPNSKAEFTTSSREESINNFRSWLKGEEFTNILQGKRRLILENLDALKGKTLGCWCRPHKPCHGEVLIELLGEEYENRPPEPGPDVFDFFG